MIKIFSPTDTSFLNNGDKILKPIKAKVYKEDNGDYYLNIETSIEYINYIVQNNIIVAPTPTGEQAFRIDSPEKKQNKITAKCWHISYDSENYLIEDSYVVDKSCNDAMDHLNNATDNPSPFKTISDITTIASYRCVRTTLYEAWQVLIERWGGHLVRDNFNIAIRSQIGKDNGVTVRYKKNLENITCNEKWGNVVTKLLPVGKDGLMLDEKYIYSDVQYDIPYTKTVSFSQEVVEDDYKDANGNLKESEYKNALKEDLLAQATAYINENKYPKVNYTLKANIENITDVGDTIQVIDERLGIELLTNVISFEYDCILGKYTEIEFGNFKNKLSDFSNKVTSSAETVANEKTEEIKTKLESALKEAQDRIWGVLGNSFVIYEGDKILVVDSLPKEDAKNVILINNGGIAFSQNGINGTFNSAWTIDGTLNMQSINVINLVADMIKGGTLKLGGIDNTNGIFELYDNENNLISVMDKTGLTVYALNGDYVKLNAEVGFAGYDKNGTKVYWADGDIFHMKNAEIENETKIAGKIKIVPVTTSSNTGIGFVAIS